MSPPLTTNGVEALPVTATTTTPAQPVISTSVSIDTNKYAAARLTLLDTGADNFISKKLLTWLQPAPTFYIHQPTTTILANGSSVQSQYMVRVYISLDPLVKTDKEPVSIFVNMIIADFIEEDIIIGNRSIHEWNLYPYIQSANSVAAHKSSAQTDSSRKTDLAKLLARPADSKPMRRSRSASARRADCDNLSIDSTDTELRLDLNRADGIPGEFDHDIDDYPPEPRLPSLDGTDTIISAMDALSITNKQRRPKSPSVASVFTSDDEKIIKPQSTAHKVSQLTEANIAKLQKELRDRPPDPDGDSDLDRVSEYSLPSLVTDDSSDTASNDQDPPQYQYNMDLPTPTEDDTSPSTFDSTSPDERVQFEEKLAAYVNPKLSAQEYTKLMRILYESRDRLSDKVHPRGADVPPMRVNLKPDATIPRQLTQRPRRMATAVDDEVHKEVDRLISMDMVEPNPEAQFYSQVLMVSRKLMDGSVKKRFCIDYRVVNTLIDTHRWPLPLIDDLIQSLNGKSVFSTLDLTQGFHQCKLMKDARKFTAFITTRGIYQYKRVPFGLSGGPSYFQHVVQQIILKGLVPSCCLVYIDDVIIFGRNQQEHDENLAKVLERFRLHRATIKLDKCRFAFYEVQYLGHLVNKDGVTLTDERRKHIAAIRQPETVSELHSFLGLANFFRNHLDFARISAPLYSLLSNKSKRAKIVWTDITMDAFKRLRDGVAHAPLLHFLRKEGDIVLYTDASDVALGGHLVQFISSVPNTVCFVSKKFSDVQTRWSTTEKELYAIVYSILKLRAMLGGRFFTVRTDHKTLTYWHSENDTPKVIRWKERLTEFDFNVLHIEGEVNCVADALSRLCAGTTHVRKRTNPAALLNLQDALPQPAPRGRPRKRQTADPRSDRQVKAKTSGAGPSPSSQGATPSSTRSHLDDIVHEAIIKEFHNDVAGHMSTLERLRKAGHNWRGMRDDIKRFRKNCPGCQFLTPNNRPAHGKHFTVLESRPFKRVYIDAIVELNGDPSYRHIVVFICAMSRFVRLFPVKDLKGSTFRHVLRSYCNSYFPQSLFWDNHGQFNNGDIDEVCQEFKIAVDTSTPYSHQENSLAERTIESVRGSFGRWKMNHPEEPWSHFISDCERIMNSQPIVGSGYTPFEIIYGTEFLSRFETLATPDAHLTEVNQLQADAATQAQGLLLQKQQEVDHLNARSRRVVLPPGSRVLVTNHKRKKQFDSTLWRGPYTVIRQEGDRLYVADLDNTGLIRQVYIKHVKLVDESLQVPPALTKANRELYEVESIQSHRFTTRGALIVSVKWTGYDQPSDEYVARNPSLRRTVAFVSYCQRFAELRHLVDNIVVFDPSA